MPSTPLIFDGHNDLLNRELPPTQATVDAFATGSPGHLDVPRMRAGGFGGGLFAVYIPSPIDMAGITEEMSQPTYDLPLPAQIDRAEALPQALEQMALLVRLEAAGHLRICTSVAMIEAAFAAGEIAAVLHMEGAEAIDADLAALEVFYAAGLRSLGPVWSRPTIFGHGVPFRFPSTGDTGPGLTDAGIRLAQRCGELGIAFDLSHATETAFWETADLGLPLIASHSNAHALCSHSRNLTDRQLRAVGESGGIVGLNFATAFLRPDGQMDADCSLDLMVRHLAHMIEQAGEDHVGLGSDFDGAIVPDPLGDVAGLPALRAAMGEAGFGDALITKVCHSNWLATLRRIWGA
ncbi:MAG: dipeptidase [Pseudomonadota bacterium]